MPRKASGEMACDAEDVCEGGEYPARWRDRADGSGEMGEDVGCCTEGDVIPPALEGLG